ncbi:hypothetical protein QTP86_028845 [Hemibagrus guttatus]|nr:hypothetical protein QTP86_028845 [Hemibagrus guttatus]
MLEELHEAHQGMENGQASGIDGLPVEFYKAFWAVIGQDVLDILPDSVRGGKLLLSCRRAVLTLLPKKGDLTHLKNWRPVSLLCTDCKLLSKALASRLTKVMERLIHQDQTYCVPDRSICNNVYLIRDILDVSRLLGLKTGLIFLDQEKAFDRVECEYLWKVLETFGFTQILSSAKVNWIKSEAILVGEWGGGQPSLPGGLEPAGKHPGPADGLPQSVLHLPKRKEVRGWSSYQAELQLSTSSPSRDASLDPETSYGEQQPVEYYTLSEDWGWTERCF